MTSEEIRETFRLHHNDVPESAPTMQLEILTELAAQLAESNESRKPRWVYFQYEGHPVQVRADLVTSVWGWDTGNGCSLRFVGDERGQTVTEDYAHVCAKLGIPV